MRCFLDHHTHEKSKMCNACKVNVADQDAATEQFAGELLETLNQSTLGLGLAIGHRTGLFDAMAAMEAGAQSIYCGMSAAVIEVLAREGVPVICHAGLVPPKATWTGGYRAVGKTAEQACQLWQQLTDFESAGN